MKTVFLSRAFLAGVLFAFLGAQGCNPSPPGDGECPTEGTVGGAATVSYASDVVPLLIETKCLTTACHGGIVPSSRFDLRTYASSFVAGDDAQRIGVCEIVPGDPERSFIIEKLRSEDPRVGLQMPLEREPLTEAQIAIIETWIREGAQNN